MPNTLRLEIDDTKLLQVFDFMAAAVSKATLEACKVTADAVAREARARVRRRGPTPTAAQLARPPLEELIRVEPMRNGTGYVVIVQETDADAALLPMILEYGLGTLKQKYPFFFASGALEKPAHTRRIQDAVQAAIDAVGGGA